MLKFVKKRLRNCKLQTQVILFQSLVILLFLILWGLVLLTFLNLFQQIYNENLFRSLVGQIYSTTVNQVFNGVNRLTNLQLFNNQQKYICYIYLFNYMTKYKIQINFKIERCLQKQYSDKFYQLQYCSGLYGNQSKDISTIEQFVALQTILLPIYFQPPLDNQAIISLDTDQYIAQYVGNYTPQYNLTLIKMINQLRKNQQYVFFQTDGSNGYSLFIIPNSSISMLGKINTSRIAIRNIVNNKYIYDVKSYLVQLDGRIILGNGIQNLAGTYYFNNTNLTGFNQSSQNLIFDFILYNINSSQNTCTDLIKQKLFCLMDKDNYEKIIAGKQMTNNSLVIFVLDSRKVYKIREDLKNQFQSFFYQSLRFLAFVMATSVFLSFVLEYYLLWKLNRQIKLLQNIVHYQIKENVLLQDIIIFKNSQSQIQQLSVAYQNLINLKTRKTHSIPKSLNGNKYVSYPLVSYIKQNNLLSIVFLLKDRIKKLNNDYQINSFG